MMNSHSWCIYALLLLAFFPSRHFHSCILVLDIHIEGLGFGKEAQYQCKTYEWITTTT